MVTAIAKEKTLGHDKISMEYFQRLWLIVGHNFHQMVLWESEREALYEEATKDSLA